MIMGCHTWFRKRVGNAPKESIVRDEWIRISELYLEELIKNLRFRTGSGKILFDKWIYSMIFENLGRTDLVEARLPEIDESTIEDEIDKVEKELEELKNGLLLSDYAFSAAAESLVSDKYDYHYSLEVTREGIFLGTDDYHDVFRVWGYPEDVLKSLSQTLDYCKERGIDLEEHQLEELKKFWNKYPDGQIYFG